MYKLNMKRFFRKLFELPKNIYLVIKYPFIAINYDRVFNDSYSSVRKDVIISLLKGNYPYTLYDCIPIGWRKSFGIKLLDELKDAAIADGVFEELKIYDIKEKYGELRIEVNISSHYVNKVIEKYEYISYRTCGICGLPADKLSGGWIFPYCKKCADKTTVIGFEDFEDWYGYKSFKNID